MYQYDAEVTLFIAVGVKRLLQWFFQFSSPETVLSFDDTFNQGYFLNYLMPVINHWKTCKTFLLESAR